MRKNIYGTLEYDKIIKRLEGMAVSETGKADTAALLPKTRLNEAEAELSETEEAYYFINRTGRSPIESFSDVRPALMRAAVGSVLSAEELLSVAKCLKSAYTAKKQLCAENIDGAVFSLASRLFVFAALHREIEACFPSVEEVADNASSTLSSIRRNIRSLNARIKDRLNDMIRSSAFQKYLQDPIVTIRNGRYVVPVKQEFKGNVPGLLHDQSASGATLFIEPMAVVEINNELKKLAAAEREEIERILADFTRRVAEIKDDIITNISILTRLDLDFARAALAIDMKAVKPILNQKGVIHIKKGRHPLIPNEEVVPVDITMDEDCRSIIITGPNTGGKTVTLKTAGLFTLMAQAGMFVPAGEDTELSVFSGVYADIGDEQSIEQSLSTFSSHMSNIVGILENASYDSLVLIDELGAGTDPTEGAALAISILERLRQRDAKVMATTHYAELKAYAMTTEGVSNAAMEFDVMTLRPTYRLIMGVPGRSNAFEISKRLGLPEYIIDDARSRLTKEDVRFEEVISIAQKQRSEAEAALEKAQRDAWEANRIKAELEEKNAALTKRRSEIIEKARAEARSIISEAADKAEKIISELKSIRISDAAALSKAVDKGRRELKEQLGELEEQIGVMPEKAPEGLMLGESVKVMGLGDAIVISLPNDKGELMVQAGIVKMNVNVNKLTRSKPKKKEKEYHGGARLEQREAALELDLRGMNVEEAIVNIERYLDDAALMSLPQVGLIHGKGTGALRAGVHEYLRRNAHVKAFRLGRYGEGESGITIVEMR
ncbi:MAG: endonuclease MutS2 [Christensenellales bacterium]